MAALFRSDNLIVRFRPAADLSRWVVSFDSYGRGRPVDRPGFGESYLQSRGMSAVVVLSRGDDWYQYPDMTKVLARIRDAVSGADRVMTYGSSMGGYAAIRFADAVGANAVLALSPQYSIDPAKVPFELRWMQEARRIAWLPALDGPIRCRVRPVVAFDSKHPLDAQHAALIAKDTPIDAVPLPWAGHPVTTYLSDAHLLTSLVPAVLGGSFDPQAFRHEALARRKASASYIAELAEYQPAARPRTAVGLARKALAISPDSELIHHILGKRLTAAGLHAEALEHHKQAVTLSGGNRAFLYHGGKALIAAGDLQTALSIARDLVKAEPDFAQMHGFLGEVLRAMKRNGEALKAFQAAAMLEPDNAVYQQSIAQLKKLPPEPGLAAAARHWLGRSGS